MLRLNDYVERCDHGRNVEQQQYGYGVSEQQYGRSGRADFSRRDGHDHLYACGYGMSCACCSNGERCATCYYGSGPGSLVHRNHDPCNGRATRRVVEFHQYDSSDDRCYGYGVGSNSRYQYDQLYLRELPWQCSGDGQCAAITDHRPIYSLWRCHDIIIRPDRRRQLEQQ